MVLREMKDERQNTNLVRQDLAYYPSGLRLPLALIAGRQPNELSNG